MTVYDHLRCPVCGSELHRKGGSLYCSGPRSHCFDLSASGYADLSRRNGGGGDPKSAVSDRTAFLERGYYAPLAQTILDLFARYTPPGGLVADAGCGEGYYSEKVAASRPEGLLFGADLSKFAVDKASRRSRAAGLDNTFYAVASVFGLPLAAECAVGALCMFSPVAEEEMLRILSPGGVLIVGSAGEEHLLGLKSAVYEEVYLNDRRADLPVKMKEAAVERVRYEIDVEGSEDVRRLFGMTPYRFRTPAEAYRRLTELQRVHTGVDVEFRVYVKN